MKKATIIISTVFFLVLAFYLGIKWQSFIYDDICLDMGGGRNPGNYSICVIEK